ncbi:MAG: YraN family protein [Chitinophagales bacterium]|nr:YraN family protein [Chitinophagales bacterium]
MAKHNELGTKGEDAAVEFLQTAGHHILVRNYRYGKAEVDIISTYEKFVVFTEVKTRSTNAFGHPEEFVDKKKRRLIKSAAEEYLYQQKLDTDIRFDIISVSNENGILKIYHIEDAFFHEE